MDAIYEWIKSFNNNAIVVFILTLITIGGTIVSIITLCVASKFKKKLNAYNEKTNFIEEQKQLVDKLLQHHDSIVINNLYTNITLEDIYKYVDATKIAYTFLNKDIKKLMSKIKKMIDKKCKPEIIEENTKYKDKLCRELVKLIAQIKKENVLL